MPRKRKPCPEHLYESPDGKRFVPQRTWRDPGDYYDYDVRLWTFKVPTNGLISNESLAGERFIQKTNDTIQCVDCLGFIEYIRDLTNPCDEHLSNFPRCVNAKRYLERGKTLPSTSDSTHLASSAESSENGIDVVPLKRLKLRDEEKLVGEYAKHPLEPPCDCRQVCYANVPREAREKLWNWYWSMSKSSQKEERLKLITHHPIKERRPNSDGSIRNTTYTYALPQDEGKLQTVCRHMFLTTLGYKPTNSTLIRENFL